MRQTLITLLATCGLTAGAFAQAAAEGSDTPNLIHDRHTHQHGDAHATEAPTAARFFTTRQSNIRLPLPQEEDSFVFTVFGDRTGGPDEGVNVLADAVRDTNLFEPDMVMTVGDLIQGYGREPAWMDEMREYKAIMSELLCPWFPVAGNHDVYWRPTDDPDMPTGQHEGNYEMHFGPLWYSFSHEKSNFIVLYSDEGNPDSGEKSFRSPDAQRISPEQMAFLDQALERGKDMNHQFIFLHHPRWLQGGYGNDWTDRVHPKLVEAGNVTAVFAGHIHRMRYDPQDGIEYVTLATVGGGQRGTVPEAGYLHQYHIVTVRPDRVAMAAVPVGEVVDPREVTGAVSEETAQPARLAPTMDGSIELGSDGSASGEFAVTLTNPTSRKVEFTLSPTTMDGRWSVTPDHSHGAIQPGGSTTVAFEARRETAAIDNAFDVVRVAIDRDYLGAAFRYAIPTVEAVAPLAFDPEILSGDNLANRALRFDGDDAVAVPSNVSSLPQGPMTVEAWIKPTRFGSRVGLLTKTQGSEYGIFTNNGDPQFSIHLGGQYRAVNSDRKVPTGVWTHIAGVYDGESLALYLDGQEVGRTSVTPNMNRRVNDLPFFIAADPDGRGDPNSFYEGEIDEVRVSSAALYTRNFRPQRRLTRTADTAFLYTFDRVIGTMALDAGPESAIGEIVGDARSVGVSD